MKIETNGMSFIYSKDLSTTKKSYTEHRKCTNFASRASSKLFGNEVAYNTCTLAYAACVLHPNNAEARTRAVSQSGYGTS